jgi:hypothetical protein
MTAVRDDALARLGRWPYRCAGIDEECHVIQRAPLTGQHLFLIQMPIFTMVLLRLCGRGHRP